MKKEKKKSTFWKDFKAFISRGNIVDLAVAVVVGAAFTAIVNSVVNDVIKPLIALLVNGDMSELVVVLRAAVMNEAGEIVKEAITLNYGNLIMAILTFLIDAFVIFTAIRIVRNAQKKLKEGTELLKEKLVKEEGDAAVAAEAAPAAESVPEPAPAPAPVEEKLSPDAVALLAEIRDLLKAEKKTKRKINNFPPLIKSSVWRPDC